MAWGSFIERPLSKINSRWRSRCCSKGTGLLLLRRQRFAAETLAVSQLAHPNIVPIAETGQHQGKPYFCMKLITGMTLAERLTDGPLPMEQAAQIVRSIALAIEHAHQQNVLHRDLKPSNILLDDQSVPYVVDFGLAKLLARCNQSDANRSGVRYAVIHVARTSRRRE